MKGGAVDRALEEAAADINARDGEDYLVADPPARIAGAVVRLLRDPLERDRIGSNARRFVAAHHRWEAVLPEFELIVTGAVEQEAQPTPLQLMARSAV